MLKHSLVPSRGSYQTSDQRDLLQRGTERRFSPSQKAETGLESLVDQVVLFKGCVAAHRQINNAPILWKSFELGLQKCYMFNIRKGFLHTSTRGSILIICLGPC